MEGQLLPRSHRSKVIRETLEVVLQDRRWSLREGGHWGLLECDAGCHRISVSGTPRQPERHAQDIIRAVRDCVLPEPEDADEANELGSSSGEEALGIELLNGRLRLVSVRPDGSVSIVGTPGQLHSLLYVASMEAAGWKTLVEELEELINSPKTKEHHLHGFFERNPEFLCGDNYEEARSHIVLQRDTDGPLIPDFALKPTHADALCDLLELKLPKAKLIRVSKNRVRLSSAIMEACAQLREYKAYFDDHEKRAAIERTYGLRFFRPRMIVLIGKRSEYDPADLRNAEGDVPTLSIVTYDDIVERARARLRKR